MADRTIRNPNSNLPLLILFWTVFILAAVALGVVWVAAHVGLWMAGAASPPNDPFQLVAHLATGDVVWPPEATVVASVVGALFLALVFTITALIGRRRRAQKRPDRCQAHGAARGLRPPHP